MKTSGKNFGLAVGP